MISEPKIVPEQKTRVSPRTAAAFGLGTLAYFLFMAWDGLRAPFCSDEMMNIAEHWRHGPWRLFYSNFLLWHDFYRPMGGAFYVPIFELAGLRPRLYHEVLLTLLVVLVGLVYWLVRALGARPIEAWLAALIVSYHAGLANLYYESNHIYDVLCAIFYAAALGCYTRARSRQRPLDGRETACFFVLFLCALNSKEMAVTLPVMLVAYEWLYYGKPDLRSPGSLRRYTIPAIAGAMTAVFIYGRVWKGLLQSHGYEITNPLVRLGNFQRQEFRDLFFQPSQYDGWVAIAVVWVVAAYFAWRRPNPLLRFAWIMTVVAPLPVEFLEGRGMAVLAIPLIGWAILAAAAALGSARGISTALADDPLFGRLRTQPRQAVVLGTMVLAWAAWNRSFHDDIHAAMVSTGLPTAQTIAEFKRVRPTVRPHSTVVFLNDPFEDWDMAFIAELWFRDRTLTIRLQKKTPLKPAELAQADYLFDWRDGRLIAAGGRATNSESPRP